jgi:large subunit ribosomal protein L25
MIEVEVPIVLTGDPVLLTREGGIVEQHLQRLVVMAKPTAIPNELEVDISELTSYQPIKVSAITLPDGVTTEVEADELIAAGFVPRGQTAEEEAEEAAEAAAAAEGEAAAGGDAAPTGDGD